MSIERNGAKPFRWLLLASLGLNVALIAAMVISASGWHRPHRGGHSDHTGLPSPRLLMATLSEERQGLLDQVYGEHRKTVRAAMRERRKARRAVRSQMLATEFHPELIDQAFADLRLKDEQAAAAVQAMLKELLSQLSAEERAKIAQLLPQHGRHHRHRKDQDALPERSSPPAESPAKAGEVNPGSP